MNKHIKLSLYILLSLLLAVSNIANSDVNSTEQSANLDTQLEFSLTPQHVTHSSALTIANSCDYDGWRQCERNCDDQDLDLEGRRLCYDQCRGMYGCR